MTCCLIMSPFNPFRNEHIHNVHFIFPRLYVEIVSQHPAVRLQLSVILLGTKIAVELWSILQRCEFKDQVQKLKLEIIRLNERWTLIETQKRRDSTTLFRSYSNTVFFSLYFTLLAFHLVQRKTDNLTAQLCGWQRWQVRHWYGTKYHLQRWHAPARTAKLVFFGIYLYILGSITRISMKSKEARYNLL